MLIHCGSLHDIPNIWSISVPLSERLYSALSITPFHIEEAAQLLLRKPIVLGSFTEFKVVYLSYMAALWCQQKQHLNHILNKQ